MQNFVELVVLALAKAKVEFIVVGGISAVLNGAPVSTRDIDICYRRVDPNLVRLADALLPLQPRLRDLPEGLPNVFDVQSLRFGCNFTLEIDNQFLDLLGIMSGIGGYDEVVGRAIEMDVAGQQVKVLSLDDLIRTKTAAGRPKDLAMLPLLEATRKVQRELDGN